MEMILPLIIYLAVATLITYTLGPWLGNKYVDFMLEQATRELNKR